MSRQFSPSIPSRREFSATSPLRSRTVRQIERQLAALTEAYYTGSEIMTYEQYVERYNGLRAQAGY